MASFLSAATFSCTNIEYADDAYPRKYFSLLASSTKAYELACVWMTVNTMNGMTSLRDCGKDVYCRRFFAVYFSPNSDTLRSAKFQ